MNSKPCQFGVSIEFQAVACVFAFCGAVMLFVCWQAAIPLLLIAAAFGVYARFFAMTVTADDKGLAFTKPGRRLNAFYAWSQFACLYRLVGVTRTLYLFSPARLTKDDLRALVRRHDKHRGPVPDIDGCLIVNYGRGNAKLDALIPEDIQRVPYSECISL